MQIGLGLGLTYLRSVGSGGGGSGLSRFFSGGVAGKTVTMWGDSTTQVALNMWDIIDRQVKGAGGELAGCNFVNLGLNGQTMAGASVAELVATDPDLVVLCFGLNDVRLGGVTVPDMQSRISTKIEAVRALLPNCDFVLWTPNSMLSTDPGSTGYVVPLASAQAYTDTMWNAYNNLVGTIPNAIHVDKMQVFGRTCPATSVLMTDILHPSNEGQSAAFSSLLPLITPPTPPINLTASAAAWASNPNNPWTVYSRALEDTRYCELITPVLITNYIDLDPSLMIYFGPAFNAEPIVPSDFDSGFVWTPNGVYTITGFEGKSVNGSNGVSMYSITKADFPINSPPLYNARLYRRLP